MNDRASLQKKSSARFAAVQCLYRQAMTDGKQDAEKLVQDYKTEYAEGMDDELAPATTPDWNLFAKIVYGVTEQKTDIEALIEPLLRTDWKKERMGPLMLAFLHAAAFELKYLKQKPAVIASEYVTLAGEFFGESEQGFINAFIEKLA